MGTDGNVSYLIYMVIIFLSYCEGSTALVSRTACSVGPNIDWKHVFRWNDSAISADSERYSILSDFVAWKKNRPKGVSREINKMCKYSLLMISKNRILSYNVINLYLGVFVCFYFRALFQILQFLLLILSIYAHIHRSLKLWILRAKVIVITTWWYT